MSSFASATAPPRSRRGLALALAVPLASGCFGIPDRSYLRVGGAARPEYAAPAGVTLAEKAERFERLLDRFVSPLGTLVYIQRSGATGFEWRRQSDQAIWTGMALAAESMRWAATRDPHALERVRAFARGLHALGSIAGVRGVYARSIWRKGSIDTARALARGDDVRSGAGPYTDYEWRGDMSKDQISGVICGLAVAWLLVDDPEVRDLARRDAAALADHLIEHDLVLHDTGGEPTEYSDLNGRIAGLPIGLNALIALSAYKIAAVATGEEKYVAAYADLVERAYPSLIYWTKFQIFGKTNHNNDNMQFIATLPLLLLEAQPAIRREVARGVERTLAYVQHEGNSWFNYVAMLAVGYDRGLAEDARLTLALFPLDKRTLAVDVTGDERFEQALFSSRKGRPKAKYPLPINYRPQTTFAWRDDPYELRSYERSYGDDTASPVDYLLAYWTGRYLGFLTAAD